MYFLLIFTNVSDTDNFTDTQAKKVAKVIKRFSPFLKDFSYVGFNESKGMNHWRFSYKFTDYIFKIIFAEKNDNWTAKIFVYWKKPTKDSTAGAGKDFEIKIGPHKSFSELITDIEGRIKNNPIMGHNIYDDDSELNMDKESVPLIVLLKKSKDKLSSIDGDFFKDLKKIYKKVKNIPNDKLLHYCKIHNKSMDKQIFLTTLQKLHMLDYYLEMKKIGHTK